MFGLTPAPISSGAIAEMFLERHFRSVRFTERESWQTVVRHPIRLPIREIPKAGTDNDDKNPPRVSRNLLTLRWPRQCSLRRSIQGEFAFTVINLANKTAVYNFLSTIRGRTP